MNAIAVPQAALKFGRRRGLAVLALALAGVMAGSLGTGALAASPVGKDGKIRACYRVKGKPKGAMRLVKSAKARCRPGERRIAWMAAGALASAGAPGQQGAAGATGSTASASALEAKVAGLTARVESLEAILAGVTNGELLAALDALTAVESLCTQTTALTTQVNAVGTALGGIALGGLIPPGLGLTIPSLEPLSGYACP